MSVILILGIFYTIRGIAGMMGHSIVREEYEGYCWTKEYKKSIGISYLILGVPYIILGACGILDGIKLLHGIVLILLTSIPSFVYSLYIDKKYKVKYESEQRKLKDKETSNE